MPSFQRGDWDGYYRPGKWCRQMGDGWEFRGSRGLLPRLMALGPDIDFRGEFFRGTLTEGMVSGIEGVPTLRDYQREALVKSLLCKWGRIAFATNAGKGAVIGLLARLLQKEGRKSLILCDELAVFQALQEEVEAWAGVTPSLVESGRKEPPEGAVVIGMVPTLARRFRGGKEATIWKLWLSEFTGVFLDEADKATAATWRRVLRYAGNSEYRLGFSGTFPSDAYGDLLMDELMGPILLREKNIDLVERGISARPQVVLSSYDASDFLDYFPPDWKRRTGPERRRWVFETAVVFNQERHQHILSLIQPGTPTCVIVNRVVHGEQLADVIPGSVFLSGSASKSRRNEVLGAFAAGEFSVLIVTKILDRGTNRLGHAVDLIFASGEGSLRQSLQRIGRGLRRTGGKEFLRLVDVIDRGHKYLHKGGRKRIELYHREEFNVEIG
jgi:superfamily II DNA or RNA helicase